MLYSVTRTSIETNAKEERTTNSPTIVNVFFDEFCKDCGDVCARGPGDLPGEKYLITGQYIIEVKVIDIYKPKPIIV